MEELKWIAAAFEDKDQEFLQQLLTDERLRLSAMLRPDAGGLQKAGAFRADGLVLYAPENPEKELSFAERLYMTRCDLPIILICGQVSAAWIDKAMCAGIRRVIDKETQPEEIRRIVLSVLSMEKNRAVSVHTVTSSYDSKIIQVFCPKGGTGKTTVAVNTAVALAAQGKKVALLDLDLQFGDVGIFLDLGKADTISDLVEDNTFDYSSVKSYLVRHYSGIDVLIAPASPEYAELVKAEHVEKILALLRGEYDFLVIDMPPAFNDCSIAALELSDSIYFVVTEDISALRNAKICFSVLEMLNVKDKVHLIINKDGISGISVKDVENALDQKAELVLPNDQKLTTKAINRGIPVVLGDKKCRLAQELNHFAATLCAESTKQIG